MLKWSVGVYLEIKKQIVHLIVVHSFSIDLVYMIRMVSLACLP
jgi:hypothetical protein